MNYLLLGYLHLNQEVYLYFRLVDIDHYSIWASEVSVSLTLTNSDFITNSDPTFKSMVSILEEYELLWVVVFIVKQENEPLYLKVLLHFIKLRHHCLQEFGRTFIFKTSR